MPDYYGTLGVPRDADEAQIKKAFRRLARELHPDANPDDPTAEARFKEAAAAYEVLSDPERRRLYDAYGEDGLRSGGYAGPSFEGFGSFSDIFSAFFGGGGAGFEGAFGTARAQGGDAAVAVTIDLADVVRGTQTEIAFEALERCRTCHGNRAEPGTPIVTCPRCKGSGQLRAVSRSAFGQVVRAAVCDTCHGDGRVAQTPCGTCDGRGSVVEERRMMVEIPAGIADGQRIRLSGRGHAAESGGPPGDLYVLVRVREDERFVREGADLVTMVDVPAPLAALGTRVEVPTLDGSVPLDIPAGTQPFTEIRLGGRGLPPLRRGRTGDLRVVVNVTVPKRLSREQRDLLERLARTLPDHDDGHGGADREGVMARLKRALAG